MILVKKKANYACFHIHTEAVSTWSHGRHVEKNGYATSKQTLKMIATAKYNANLKQSCGTIKMSTPT